MSCETAVFLSVVFKLARLQGGDAECIMQNIFLDSSSIGNLNLTSICSCTTLGLFSLQRLGADDRDSLQQNRGGIGLWALPTKASDGE